MGEALRHSEVELPMGSVEYSLKELSEALEAVKLPRCPKRGRGDRGVFHIVGY